MRVSSLQQPTRRCVHSSGRARTRGFMKFCVLSRFEWGLALLCCSLWSCAAEMGDSGSSELFLAREEVDELAPEAESVTERALVAASALPPDELFEIGIELEEPGFDFSRLEGADANTRAALIAERRNQLAPFQGAVEVRTAEVGGEALARMWLVNVVDVRVPAGRVEELVRWCAPG